MVIRPKSTAVTTHQHVFSKPALALGQYGANTQSKAFLAQQGVATIATTVGTDLIFRWQVGDDCVLGVTRPVVVQRTCCSKMTEKKPSD